MDVRVLHYGLLIAVHLCYCYYVTTYVGKVPQYAHTVYTYSA
jgi:hypothetical protein